MHIRESIDKIEKVINQLKFDSNYVTGNQETPYLAKNLNSLRNAIQSLENIDVIKPEIQNLLNSEIFKNHKDENLFSSSQNSVISTSIKTIQEGFKLLKRHYQHSLPENEDLYIKLPEIETFDELSKVSNELKKAIEIPINDQNTNGIVKIKTAEPGSIWLLVSLGAFSAVNLVGAICWTAAVLRKKRAEAKIFEEHAKTLGIKNETLTSLVEAQKEQLKNILDAEAKLIMKDHYNVNDPETLNRLKLSITTVSNLIDKGTKFLPASTEKNVQEKFPDYNNLNLIESTIKMLKDNNIS